MSNELTDKVALVTGAGSGIGRAMVSRLAGAGASVILVGRDRAKLDAVADETPAGGGTLVCVALDITRPEAGATLAQAVSTLRGRLDILVHSAGVFHLGSVRETATDVVRDELEVNAIAPYALTRCLVRFLVESTGQVVFMNSSVVGARRGGIAAYAASKAALLAIADALREEVNAHGVRVLSAYVGRTATPMQERIFAAEGRAYEPSKLLQPDDVASIVTAALSLPATAEVTDLHIRPMRKSST
jgi:NADP-dependent 3-hydroxy acid dehydrogenase YdfG